MILFYRVRLLCKFCPTVVATLVCLFWRKRKKRLNKRVAVCTSACSVSMYVCVCLHAPAMCNALSSGSPSTYISLIHMYSSAPKDWFSFQELPKMTHFSILDTLSKGLDMNALFSRRGQTGEALVCGCRYIFENEPLLCFSYSLPCVVLAASQNRAFWEFAQN